MLYEKRLLILSGIGTGCVRLERTSAGINAVLSVNNTGGSDFLIIVRDNSGLLTFVPSTLSRPYTFTMPASTELSHITVIVAAGDKLLLSGTLRNERLWQSNLEDEIRRARKLLGQRPAKRSVSDFFLDIMAPEAYDDNRVAEVNYYHSNLAVDKNDIAAALAFDMPPVGSAPPPPENTYDAPEETTFEPEEEYTAGTDMSAQYPPPGNGYFSPPAGGYMQWNDDNNAPPYTGHDTPPQSLRGMSGQRPQQPPPAGGYDQHGQQHPFHRPDHPLPPPQNTRPNEPVRPSPPGQRPPERGYDRPPRHLEPEPPAEHRHSTFPPEPRPQPRPYEPLRQAEPEENPPPPPIPHDYPSEDPIMPPPTMQPPPVLKSAAFYDTVKSQLEKLFAKNEHYGALERLLPDSKWIRVDYDNKGKFYLIGLIGEPVRYICYGVPGKYSPRPPAELAGYCQWLAIDENDPVGEGFWVMYQDAVSGKSIL